MFVKSTIVALALTLSTCATPLPEESAARIDFQRRNVLINDEGWFDHDAAARQVAHDRKSVK